VAAGRARGADVVIIATAGRLQTQHNLMEELRKVHGVVGKAMDGAPHHVLLVIDSTTGQNGLSQARLFSEAVPVTGLVLTKFDGVARGGIVLAIERELGIPVTLIGVGETIGDLQPFDARAFAEAIFSPASGAGQ
jgi:fused signal recognition particle receptor